MKSKECILIFAFSMGCANASAGSDPKSVVFDVKRCEELAAINSMDVRNAALDVKSAHFLRNEALWEYFPTVNAMGLGFHAIDPLIRIQITDVIGTSELAYQIQDMITQRVGSLGLNTSYSGLQYGYTAGVNVTQPLFAGGRIVNGNRLARVAERVAQSKNSLQKRSTSEQVQKNFYQIVALQQKLSTVDTLERILATVYGQVKDAADNGLIPQTEASALEIRLSELRAGRSKLRMGLRVAKMNMLNDLGVEYNAYAGITPKQNAPFIDSFVFEGRLDDIPTPSDVYVDENNAVSNLDESRLLQLQVEALKLKKRMTLGETLPSVALGFTYGYAKMINDPRWNGTLYLMVKVPITEWGKNANRLERSQIEINKAENQKEHFGNQLVLQLRALYVEMAAAYDQMQIASESEKLANLRLKQLQENCAAGISSATDLLQCESAWQQAYDTRIDATMDYLCAMQAYCLRTK